ncbi:MAG TPA: protein-glutamate O-methyltransferase CheR [Polyangiaceae bacterium]|nr:protein-glutamate O-methyltransferase CheR [Polyangiaceae bacterium]
MNTRALPLPAAVFTILSGLIEERLGLFFSENDADILAEKVTPRALELGFDSLLDYYYYLRYDAGAVLELQRLAEALVVNETYIGRELDQLTALADILLPRLLATRPHLRVWSAACSTGEEPLTLAGLLDDRGLLPSVELLASDISLRVLEQARSGKFSGRSLRALPPASKGWLSFDGASAFARPELLRSVSFRQLNLNDREAVRSVGKVDVIICRNVLIYFRDSTIKTLVQSFNECLNPGGYLLVGASESLLRFGGDWRCEEHGGAFFYRKDVS